MKASKRARKTTVGEIDAEVLAYTAGEDLALDQALVEMDVLGTAAHVTMLSAMRIRPPLFTAVERRRVLAELVAILRTARAGRFTIRPEDQDGHLAIERVLTEKLGDLGKRVHTARSRNDQVATALRLFSKLHLLETIGEAAALARALIAFAERHAGVPMVGRTHQQPAMPSSVGLWASAHAESLLDDLALLLGAYELNDQCPLGSAASYGVPLPIDRALTARLLGFSRPTHNVLYANNARGKLEAATLSSLGQTMLSASRLAQDLIQFTMPEFNYFTLPHAFCTGSSIMPQKLNPDILELTRAKAARVLSAAACTAEIVRAAPSGYNRDLQETKGLLMDGFAQTRATLRILAPLIAQTGVNADALRAAFTPEVFATDRALELVGRGMPFRDAYHHVKEHLDELARQDPDAALALKTHLGAPLGLDFPALRLRADEASSLAAEELQEFARAMSRLLGVRWPVS